MTSDFFLGDCCVHPFVTFTDGKIDFRGRFTFDDFLILAENFGKSTGNLATVPEPNFHWTLAILAFTFVRQPLRPICCGVHEAPLSGIARMESSFTNRRRSQPGATDHEILALSEEPFSSADNRRDRFSYVNESNLDAAKAPYHVDFRRVGRLAPRAEERFLRPPEC